MYEANSSWTPLRTPDVSIFVRRGFFWSCARYAWPSRQSISQLHPDVAKVRTHSQVAIGKLAAGKGGANLRRGGADRRLDRILLEFDRHRACLLLYGRCLKVWGWNVSYKLDIKRLSTPSPAYCFRCLHTGFGEGAEVGKASPHFEFVEAAWNK